MLPDSERPPGIKQQQELGKLGSIFVQFVRRVKYPLSEGKVV